MNDHASKAAHAQPHFHRVCIIGVGLLGASLGLALKAAHLADKVVGVGRAGSPSLAVALERGAIDQAHTDPLDGVAGADLVVICTPLLQFEATLKAIKPGLSSRAMITDVGSTKMQVMDWVRRILGPDALFVGSHPMAGSEQRGPAAARADLYQNAVCLMTPLHGAPPQVFEKISALWQALGMRTIPVDADLHDRWVATISHVPHAAAFALFRSAADEPDALHVAAGGFTDTTRIASSDPDVWTDIFMTNREAVMEALDRYMQELSTLWRMLESDDAPALRQYLDQTRQQRQAWLKQRQNRSSS
ncbi:MAG: prephenate dehydrogenase [Phycisphaerae bacterium]